MKSVVAHAIGYCVVLLLAAAIAYVWWYHVASRPVITGPSAAVIASLESTQDVETLRKTALLLAKGRIESGKVVDDILSAAFVAIIIACLAGVLSVVIVTLRALMAFRAALGQDLGWLRYIQWL